MINLAIHINTGLGFFLIYDSLVSQKQHELTSLIYYLLSYCTVCTVNYTCNNTIIAFLFWSLHVFSFVPFCFLYFFLTSQIETFMFIITITEDWFLPLTVAWHPAQMPSEKYNIYFFSKLISNKHNLYRHTKHLIITLTPMHSTTMNSGQRNLLHINILDIPIPRQ